MLEVSGGFRSFSLPTGSIPQLELALQPQEYSLSSCCQKSTFAVGQFLSLLVMTSQQAVKSHDDITDLGDSCAPHSKDTAMPSPPLWYLLTNLVM